MPNRPSDITKTGQLIWGDVAETIPEGITHILTDSFSHYAKIRNVVLPSTVTQVDEGAFENIDIESIYIPSSLEFLPPSALYFCKNLTKIEVEEGHPSLSVVQGCLYHNRAEKIIFVPSNVDLSTLEAPLADRSVTSYDVEIFEVPKNIKNVSAFYYPNLKEITFHFPVDPLTEETFEDCPDLVWVYCYGFREDFWTIAPPEPYNRDHWMNRVNIRYLGPKGWIDQITRPPRETTAPTPESTIEPALPEETAQPTPQSGCSSAVVPGTMLLICIPALCLIRKKKRK